MVVKSCSAYKISRSLTIMSLFGLLMLASNMAIAATIQVSTDRNPVSLNESFQLVYKSSDSVDDDPDFSVLNKYIDILNQNQSSHVSIINGSYNSSKTWTLSVMAREIGVVVLPPVMFGSDQSDSYTLAVNEAAKNQQVQDGFYTRIKVDQEQVYAQQQLVITQQIFSDQNLSAYGMGELDFNGMDVISQPLGEEKQFQTRIRDKAYLVIERSYAIFPQSSGLLKLSPVLAEARIGRSSNSFFDSLGRNKVIRARSNALNIAVLQVPENININPWLPAKDFQLQEQWPQNPPKFIQGEPITRTLSIKAEGLTAAQIPVLPDMSIDGLKQYPDQPLLNDITNETGITGYRIEKVALIPTRAGEMTLPAITIPWWNSITLQREVAHIPARTITVEAALVTETAPVTPALVTENSQQASEQSVQQQTPQSVSVDAKNTSQLWFILALLFAAGWLITVIAWVVSVKKKSPERKDVAEPTTNVKEAFKQLKKACEKEEAAECRQQLLIWARALLPAQNIKNLTDLIQFSTLEMKAEIKKIDAMLYSQQDQQVSFAIIIDQATRMMQDYKQDSVSSKPQLLEPLYK